MDAQILRVPKNTVVIFEDHPFENIGKIGLHTHDFGGTLGIGCAGWWCRPVGFRVLDPDNFKY